MQQPFKRNAIVLHKILNETPRAFEDIELERFKTILNHKLPCLSAPLAFEYNKPSLITTFDDGNNSDIEIVLPLLLESKASASFFIVPSFVGSHGFMSWDDIIKLAKSGMDIGSHSLSHIDFRKIDYNRTYLELNDSKKIIEDKIGKPVISFSFPYGFSSKNAHKIAKEIGYRYVFDSKHGVINECNSSEKILPRNSINRSMSNKRINKVLDGGLVIINLWYLEDFIKDLLKLILPQRIYFLLRSIISKGL